MGATCGGRTVSPLATAAPPLAYKQIPRQSGDWRSRTRTQLLGTADKRKEADKAPHLEKFRTLSQKIEYQLKYGKSRSFWVRFLLSDFSPTDHHVGYSYSTRASRARAAKSCGHAHLRRLDIEE